MAKTVKEWILSHRLENYGYDWKDFNKMSANKTKLKSKIKQMSDADIRRNLAQAGILGSGKRLSKVKPYKKVIKNGKEKWVRDGSRAGEWDYTTGQSFNEEIINIATIGATKGKKSFWDVQDRWFK